MSRMLRALTEPEQMTEMRRLRAEETVAIPSAMDDWDREFERLTGLSISPAMRPAEAAIYVPPPELIEQQLRFRPGRPIAATTNWYYMKH